MKRILAVGGAAAGLLASAVVTAPANAAPRDSVPSVNMANTDLAAQEVAAFWYGEAKAYFLNATPYGVETKVVAKHVSTGGPATDTKPGLVPAIGDEKKSTARSKNVNLPKTTGKVFFIGADNEPHWCTATSVQSGYRNLVATAGHCVYDTGSNKTTLDKWVFVPGYYKGRTPWGIYVGKQAFTHYDYDVYEDGDRDYAFVTVYNGVLPAPVTSDRTYESKVYETRREAEWAKRKLERNTDWSDLKIIEVKRPVEEGTPGAQTGAITVSEFESLNKGKNLTGNGPWAKGTSASDPVAIDKGDYKLDKDAYVSLDGKTLYWRKPKPASDTPTESTPSEPAGTTPTDSTSSDPAGTTPTGSTPGSTTPTDSKPSKDDKGGKDGKEHGGGYGGGHHGGGHHGEGREYTYYKRTFSATYIRGYQVVGKRVSVGLKDVGRLGDNVGGQGLAYNQKIGKPVFVFGYPSGSHPDGNYAFTGHTLKWSYGKTFAASAKEIKAEELVGVKSPFTGEGSIGSSWLLNYQSNRRIGYLNGVTIGLADVDKNGRIDTSVSPYFDGELYGVYKAAAGLWSGKIV
ncbi:hypothetical protein [Microtetraspora sp. NBRC 16547]|uniref:trypsin-like serine peptidase n=1 Tax=Microtetraspora sp. NBRC 16547 TaxID=3030993 RepID=UPI0024A0A22F|nr:hypothetical protein [Microtetraspora sp. NBRC 16547]GLW97555.1 hypothetical protein Misp02_16420 [Microtetraspora sp. NBRC 16547]